MDFITIDNREIPTCAYLKKKGIMTNGGGMPALKMILKDDDNILTTDNVRCIVWNLQRQSSLTYILRYIKLLELFEKEYEKFISRENHTIDDNEIKSLKSLNDSIAAATEGFDAVKTNNKLGYRCIASDELDFTHWFTQCNMHYDPDFTDLGYDRITMNYPFKMIYAASGMSFNLYSIAFGAHKIPESFEPPYNIGNAPQSATYEKSARGERFKTGDTVPFSGIWNPYTFKSGCPNYLIKGTPFPETGIAVVKFYYPEFYDEDKSKIYAGTQRFEYEYFPSDWQLLWEDTRYTDGKIPEYEKEYLDESIAIPEGSTDEVQ